MTHEKLKQSSVILIILWRDAEDAESPGWWGAAVKGNQISHMDSTQSSLAVTLPMIQHIVLSRTGQNEVRKRSSGLINRESI